jgi:hypothetical protein
MALPKTATWIIQERDTTVTLSDRPKIVAYYNANGCTPCRMNDLYSWNDILKETSDEDSLINADFVFIFKSDPQNEEFRQNLISKEFHYPVLCDDEGEFEENNVLPKNELYHVFLLDRDDKIILAGSPIYNPKLWELYKNKIASMAI